MFKNKKLEELKEKLERLYVSNTNNYTKIDETEIFEAVVDYENECLTEIKKTIEEVLELEEVELEHEWNDEMNEVLEFSYSFELEEQKIFINFSFKVESGLFLTNNQINLFFSEFEVLDITEE